jgi:hypothetical protein
MHGPSQAKKVKMLFHFFISNMSFIDSARFPTMFIELLGLGRTAKQPILPNFDAKPQKRVISRPCDVGAREAKRSGPRIRRGGGKRRNSTRRSRARASEPSAMEVDGEGGGAEGRGGKLESLLESIKSSEVNTPPVTSVRFVDFAVPFLSPVAPGRSRFPRVCFGPGLSQPSPDLMFVSI